jgi:hypothetical protein
VYRFSKGFEQNLLCNFWTYVLISIDLQSLEQFLGFKSIQKKRKPCAQCGATFGPRLQPSGPENRSAYRAKRP